MSGILKNYKLPKLLRKFTITELARGAGVNQKTLYKNLSGKTPMGLRTAVNLAKFAYKVKNIKVNEAGCEFIETLPNDDWDNNPNPYGRPLMPIAGLLFELDGIYARSKRKRIIKK